MEKPEEKPKPSPKPEKKPFEKSKFNRPANQSIRGGVSKAPRGGRR